MAFVNVDKFNIFEGEKNISELQPLLDKKYPYGIAVSSRSTTSGLGMIVDYYVSENPLRVYQSGVEIYVDKGNGYAYCISPKYNNGAITQVGGATNNMGAFDSSVDVLIRNSLIGLNKPTISIQSQDLGDILSFASIPYSIEDLDNDLINIVEKLDNNVINTYSNVSSGTTKLLDLSSRWDSISYGKHTIDIIVSTSEEGSENTTTITFYKIKEPISPIPMDSTLTQATNHMIELNKEIDYQELKLSNNLVAKGVEVSPTDKMSNLIDKVGTIATGKKWASGVGSGWWGKRPGQSTSYTYAYAEVNFGFVPSVIVVSFDSQNYSQAYMPYPPKQNSTFVVISDVHGRMSVSKDRYTSENYVDANGFCFRATGSSIGGQPLTWIAFE